MRFGDLDACCMAAKDGMDLFEVEIKITFRLYAKNEEDAKEIALGCYSDDDDKEILKVSRLDANGDKIADPETVEITEAGLLEMASLLACSHLSVKSCLSLDQINEIRAEQGLNPLTEGEA